MMRIVFVTGVPKSGKTTIFLNCRKVLNVLVSDLLFEQVGKVMFVGGGIQKGWTSRLVGTDMIGRSSADVQPVVNDLIASIHRYKDENVPEVLLVESRFDVIDIDFAKSFDVEIVVRFNKVTRDRFAGNGVKELDLKMGGQERLLESTSECFGGYDFKVWESESLEDRVNDVLRLIGRDERIGKAEVDFIDYAKIS